VNAAFDRRAVVLPLKLGMLLCCCSIVLLSQLGRRLYFVAQTEQQAQLQLQLSKRALLPKEKFNRPMVDQGCLV
jgi:hypothetical protein